MNDINEFKNLLDQSQKLYGGWNAFAVEAEASFNKMALAIPMLFQNKSAISNYGSISKTVEMKLPPKLTYDEAISQGLKAEYTGRVFGEQAANTTLALATAGVGSALGVGAGALSTAQAIAFGTLSFSTLSAAAKRY